MHGYRWMHQKCLKEGMTVPRNVVYSLMQILDPMGIEVRRKGRLRRRQYFAKGPNYLWHVDSYDKLKPYGLCISGCIDGFSRQIMWLNVYHTSSNPRVIAGYYMETVTELLGCPQMVRGDMGTENGHIARMQSLLSGEESFLYGASMHNQKIESFWCTLRKECSQFWMDTLGSLKNRADFTGSAVDISLIQFCFTALVQRELDAVRAIWNSHRIRPSKNENVPHGRPTVMFSMPEIFHTKNFLKTVDQRDVNICMSECVFRGRSTCDPEMFELLLIYMTENNLSPPTTAREGLKLYEKLRTSVLNDLHPNM
eukprot:XP_011446570.1 PREDICTED: uncharacterized protein LOC105341643 [Crassostrea gigas]